MYTYIHKLILKYDRILQSIYNMNSATLQKYRFEWIKKFRIMQAPSQCRRGQNTCICYINTRCRPMRAQNAMQKTNSQLQNTLKKKEI